MEKAESWERKSVMSKLSEGVELSNELKKELQKENCDSRDEACQFLVEKIVSCYDNALSLLNCTDFLENKDSIFLIQRSPTSTDVSDLDFKDHLSQVVNKKRKNLPTWSEEVRDKIQVDDGFNWRKYGQKDIIGATHPRSYYRCTHRYTQKCLATKQVQRGEDDPPIFTVEYRGKHSCVVIKQNKENVNAETNDEDMTMINIESNPNVVAETQSLSPEPTTELYFSMPSKCENIRTDGDGSFLASEMITNPTCTANFQDGDSDFLIDLIDFDSDAPNYFSPESKIM